MHIGNACLDYRYWALDRRVWRKRELGSLSMEWVGANRPKIIHTGTGSRVLGWAKGRDGAAYVMPDWAGRIANV